MPESTAEAEAPVIEDSTPTGTEGAQAEVETEGTIQPSTEATEAAATEGTVDAPDRYFEVDLSGLPAEERLKVIEALKDRDDEIGKLLRGAKETPPEGEQPAPEAPQPMTDEEILQRLQLDPENPFDETATKVALPLVRALQGLQEQVASIVEERELEQLDRYWMGSLDKLEADNGVLPIDRTAVIEYAAANGLNTPEDAYWRIAGPARQQTEKLTRDALARASAPAPVKKPTSVRPAGGGATSEVPVSAPTVKGAVKDAASQVLRDLGIGE